VVFSIKELSPNTHPSSGIMSHVRPGHPKESGS
jgi:hypothetical protein